LGGRPLTLETGKIAKQANGAIVARYGDTVVLTTACMASTTQNDRDFLAADRGLQAKIPTPREKFPEDSSSAKDAPRKRKF
jgi:hypothetical protein